MSFGIADVTSWWKLQIWSEIRKMNKIISFDARTVWGQHGWYPTHLLAGVCESRARKAA